MAIAETPPRLCSMSAVASASRVMQSQSTLPLGVLARIARCPIPNDGVVSIVISPGARRRNLLLCDVRRSSRVVQDCPEAGTNCRSSLQIGHASGGDTEGGYCVPQAVQMKAGMSELTDKPPAWGRVMGLT